MPLDQTDVAAWVLWTMESRRSEHARSRFYHILYTKYPSNRFWIEDLLRDAVKTGVFRYGIKSKSFFVLLYRAGTQTKYGKMELRAMFKVEISKELTPEKVEIKSASFTGPDARLANYEWRYGTDPLKMPAAPVLVPGDTDVLKSSMFLGPEREQGHYSKVYYPRKLPQPSLHQYPHKALHFYGAPMIRRTGLPSTLLKFTIVTRSSESKKKR